MKASEIAAIAANVMYIDDANEIDVSRSLFNDYAMSSLDFVDFAFELKSSSGKDFSPDQLWPVNGMMSNPEFYKNGKWTDDGKAELLRLFAGFTDLDDHNLSVEKLHNLFSVRFIEHRLGLI